MLHRTFDAVLAQTYSETDTIAHARQLPGREAARFHAPETHYNMEAFVAFDICQDAPDYPLAPGVCPSLGRLPQAPKGQGLPGCFFELLGDWVMGKAHGFAPVGDENLLFINDWNESAECNYLDPCLRYAGKWLEPVQQALSLKGACACSALFEGE